MYRAIAVLGCAGALVSCAQVLGLDSYKEGAGGGATSSTQSGNPTSGTGSPTGPGPGGTTTGQTGATTTGVSSGASGTGGAGGQAPTYAAKAVTAGAEHSCALLVDGHIVCWGKNDDGQLGDGSFMSSPTPVLVAGIDNAKQVDAGAHHTCAVLTTGEVRCWGDNSMGEVGVAGADQDTPIAPTGLPANIAAVSAGELHTCAFVMGGAAYCWGSNSAGQLGRNVLGGGTNVAKVDTLMVVSSISASGDHTCATADTQIVWCWGQNAHGQSGGATAEYEDPHQVGFIGSPGPPEAGPPVVVAGESSCNLKGTPWCWGRDDAGQLGLGATSADIGQADNNTLANVAQISGGAEHFCARIQNGNVMCWGSNQLGQLGNGTDGNNNAMPAAVMNLSAATDIGVGATHSCAVVEPTPGHPAVRCWGGNAAGQLGDGTMMGSDVPVDVQYLP